MDIRQLLGKLDLIEGSMKAAEKHPTGPKFTGQWKGKDKGTPGTKMVGGMEESILKDLNKGPTPKTKEQELAEQFEQFLQALEEENLGVADKRPARKGARPARDYGKTGEPSKRYNQVKEGKPSEFRQRSMQQQQEEIAKIAADPRWTEIEKEYLIAINDPKGKVYRAAYYSFPKGQDAKEAVRQEIAAKHNIDPATLEDAERQLRLDNLTKSYWLEKEQLIKEISNPHDVIKQKLQDVERQRNPQPASDDLQTRAARAKAEYRKYVAKMKKKNPDYIPLYKVDEAGANNPPQQNTTTQANPQQQQQAKNVAQGTQALKAAIGSTAPTDVLAKAIDTASQGTQIDAKSAQALEPVMNVVKQAAQDPNLANQFKSFVSQARTSATKQQQTNR